MPHSNEFHKSELSITAPFPEMGLKCPQKIFGGEYVRWATEHMVPRTDNTKR